MHRSSGSSTGGGRSGNGKGDVLFKLVDAGGSGHRVTFFEVWKVVEKVAEYTQRWEAGETEFDLYVVARENERLRIGMGRLGYEQEEDKRKG